MDKNKQLIYSTNKPGRGVKYKLYANGEVVIHGKGSQYGINIPASLRDWIKHVNKAKKWSYKLKVDLSVTKNAQTRNFPELAAELTVKDKSWYLLPEKVPCFGTDTYKLFAERVTLVCTFKLPPKIWSKKFRQAIQIINLYSHNEKSDFSVIVFGGKGTGSYEVLQDSQGHILVKFSGSIKDGAIQLPAELEKIFQGWTITRDQLLCICENELPIIGYITLINSKSRPERVRKVLHIPYIGLRKQVDLILYSPNFKLTEQIQLDLEIKEQLVKAGCNISSLISNVKPGSDHRDRTLEQKYQQFLTKVFDKHEETYTQSEVRISTSTNQKNIPIKNSYTFDFMVFQKAKSNDDQSLTLLCEFKTSIGKGKAVIITEAIADLRHIHQQINENITIPILFLCKDLMVGNEVITSIYSNYCNVLLIGPKEFVVFEDNPTLFLDRIEQYQQAQKVMRNQSDYLVHPLTEEIVSRSELEREAHTLLTLVDNLTHLTDNMKRSYCSLMGIRLHDFNILFKYFQKELLADVNSKKITFENSERIYQTYKPALKKMHKILCAHKSVAIVEVLDKLRSNDFTKKLLKQKETIFNTFPPEVVILGQKLTNKRGLAFEKEIRTYLEKKYSSVVSNMWCYYRGRKFEVDLVGFKGKKIIITSCKDMSTYQSWDQLVVDIKKAVNKLKYRKDQTNGHLAKLYVKPNPIYKKRLQQKFDSITWSKNVEIVFRS